MVDKPLNKVQRVVEGEENRRETHSIEGIHRFCIVKGYECPSSPRTPHPMVIVISVGRGVFVRSDDVVDWETDDS